MHTPRLLFRPLTEADFAEVLALGNKVHGENYLNPENLADYYERGQTENGRNLHWLAFSDDKLAGIRLTFAPGKWDVDQYCTPSAWPFAAEELCYFKCSAVDYDVQGAGIGRSLLMHSIVEAQGARCKGGLAHIWRQSPNNSAFEYFTRCGGELIADHGKRWLQASLEDGYYCPVCDGDCYCTAAEMLLRFT